MRADPAGERIKVGARNSNPLSQVLSITRGIGEVIVAADSEAGFGEQFRCKGWIQFTPVE